MYVHDRTRRKITYARILSSDWGPDITMLTPARKYRIFIALRLNRSKAIERCILVFVLLDVAPLNLLPIKSVHAKLA